MLGFVFRRIKASRWMTASLLLGNLLLFCVVSAIPMYSDAILQSVMTDSLGSVQSAESKWSGSIHASFTARQERGYRAAQRIGEAAEALTDAYGVPVLAQSLTRTSFSFHFHPEASRTLLLNSPSAAVCASRGWRTTLRSCGAGSLRAPWGRTGPSRSLSMPRPWPGRT
ncbi:MAG: hypothetical protein IKS29_00460 [Oscillospiraceae bacterium]|nr:hypothetical protein [Oscillospiraceae bacterium]